MGRPGGACEACHQAFGGVSKRVLCFAWPKACETRDDEVGKVQAMAYLSRRVDKSPCLFPKMTRPVPHSKRPALRSCWAEVTQENGEKMWQRALWFPMNVWYPMGKH